MLTVGQKLTFVGSHNWNKGVKDVTVLKIGTKWVTLDSGLRINKLTLIADGNGYSSPGRCYLSTKEYDDKCKLDKEWSIFRSSVSAEYRTPATVTLKKIKEAMEILGFTK